MKTIKNLKGRKREDLEIILRAKNVLEANGYEFNKEKKHFEKIVPIIEQKLKEEFGKDIKHNIELHRYILSNKNFASQKPHLGTIKVKKAITNVEAERLRGIFTLKELQTYAGDKNLGRLTAIYTTMQDLLIEFSARGFLPKPPIRYLYCKKCGRTTNFKRGINALDSFNCRYCKTQYNYKATDRFYDEKD
jgi:hypothetical protein